MTVISRPLLAAGLLVALGTGFLIAERAVVPMTAVGPCPLGATRFTRLELIFGMSRKGRPEIGEDAWQAFVDAEVTPRFPDGLTVLTGYGQWRGAGGQIAKETARVLLIWAKPAPDQPVRIEAIRSAWKSRHDQESVMRVESESCVAF